MKRNLADTESIFTNRIYTKLNKLIKTIDDLKECGCLSIDYSLNLPKLILIGPPSSGKTSIIESIIGYDILPKNTNEDFSVMTRRPIEIKLIHVTNNIIKPYIEFQSEGGDKIYDFTQVKEKIKECIENKTSKENKILISKEALKIAIYANNVPDVIIVDLPGVDDDIKLSYEIGFNYIKDESSIILYTLNADNKNLSDFQSSKIMSMIREVDSDLSRTIGIFTKIDSIPTNYSIPDNPLNIIKFNLENKDLTEVLFKHGFIAVKNRNSNDKISIESNLLKERDYFHSHPFFKFICAPENLTFDSLFEKIKKIFYENYKVKNNLLTLHKSLKEKIEECQKELLKFGTDYIGYTNDTKNTYVTSLINNFCETIERVFSGKMNQINENTNSAKLKETYYNFLKTYKTGYTPATNIKNEEIIRIIKRTEGEGLSGFPESEVIYALLEDEMDKLREEVKNYLDLINDLTREAVKNSLIRIFCRFPKLMDRVEEIMNTFIEENFDKMKHLVESVAEMNFNYLYIDESSLSYNVLLKKFIINDDGQSVLPNNTGRDRSNTISSHNSNEKEKEKIPNFNYNEKYYNESDKEHYYNGLAEYIKILINYFFSIIIRNLRENVPKITGFYFIKTLKEDLRFYLLNILTKEFSFEDYLEEDPEVAKNRNFFIDLMKILKNSEKVLQYDEELKNVIKGDRKKTIDKVNENVSKTMNDPHLSHPEKSRGNEMEKKNLNSDRKDPTSIHKEEVKFNNKNDSHSRVDHILKQNSITSNQSKILTNSSNIQNIQNTQNIKNNQKTSIQNFMREEEQPKKIETTKPQIDQTKQKDGAISIKMDPNSNDLKDMKINMNMDAETAFNLYQTNKKYLPTGQQMLVGATATAKFVEKSANAIEGNNQTNNQENLVTGNKPQKKGLFDPLTSLFGSKKDTTGKTSSSGSNPTVQNKKGQF